MIVEVEWMDGEVRRAEGAEMAHVDADKVLRVYGPITGDRRDLLAEWPVYHVREIRRIP